MKNISIIAASLIISTSAFASTQTYHDVTHKHVGDYQSQQEALQAGFSYINQLHHMSQSKLKMKLAATPESQVRNIIIDKSDVALKTVAVAPEQVKYRATVEVSYHYKAHDNNNN
ncbi:DUF3316 domain-containing protein [Vibrio aerogenes]|nr:DUF3316 domain-containing protein [Vibrio aerogenes]